MCNKYPPRLIKTRRGNNNSTKRDEIFVSFRAVEINNKSQHTRALFFLLFVRHDPYSHDIALGHLPGMDRRSLCVPDNMFLLQWSLEVFLGWRSGGGAFRTFGMSFFVSRKLTPNHKVLRPGRASCTRHCSAWPPWIGSAAAIPRRDTAQGTRRNLRGGFRKCRAILASRRATR